MNRNKIISMAEEAGFQCDSFGIGIWDNKEFNQFADILIEACTQMCRERQVPSQGDYVRLVEMYNLGVQHCVNAIEGLKNK